MGREGAAYGGVRARPGFGQERVSGARRCSRRIGNLPPQAVAGAVAEVHGRAATVRGGNGSLRQATTTGPDGKLSHTHGDKIWFWGGTTMLDPTKVDQLAFLSYPDWPGSNPRLCAGIVPGGVGLR